MADDPEKGSEEPARSNEDGAEIPKDSAPPQDAVVQQMEANEGGEEDGQTLQQRKRKASQEIVESDTNTGGTTTPVRHFTIPRDSISVKHYNTLQAFSSANSNHYQLRVSGSLSFKRQIPSAQKSSLFFKSL